MPPQVRQGSIFEVAVVGDTNTTGLSSGDSGCVLQIPNGFSVVGYRADAVAANPGGPTQFNTPLLLSAYTAQPGHYLVSFLGTGVSGSGGSSNQGRVALKVFLQAPAVAPGSYSIKVALVGGSAGAWTAHAPAGVTQFSAITAAPYSYSVSVVTGTVSDFEIDAASLPFGAYNYSGGPSFSLYQAIFEDLDGDSDADVFTGYPQLTAWTSTPGSAWSNVAIAGLGISSFPASDPIVFGDFDGDGFRDFALADGRIYWGNGGTSWTPGPTLLTGNQRGVAAGDTNSDGRSDVLLISNVGAMRLYQGNANRTFTQANNGLPTLGSGTAEDVLLADLTGDGFLDVYATKSTLPNVWIGDGLGNWTPGSGLPAQAVFRQAIAGDLTGDGAAEVVLTGNYQSSSPAGVLVYRHAGSGAFTQLLNTGLPAAQLYTSGVALLDFDGDGDRDLVLSPSSGNSWTAGGPLVPSGLQLWRNNGVGQFQLKSNSGLSGFAAAERITSGDFTGDGVADLAVSFDENKTILYRGTRVPAIARIPHGCSGQTIQAVGSGAIGTSLTTTLGNSTGIPIIGLGVALASVPLCPGCTLGHEWSALSAGSAFMLNIPNNPSLSGIQVGIQGGDVFAASGCLGLPVAFSDTLVLTVQ